MHQLANEMRKEYYHYSTHHQKLDQKQGDSCHLKHLFLSPRDECLDEARKMVTYWYWNTFCMHMQARRIREFFVYKMAVL